MIMRLHPMQNKFVEINPQPSSKRMIFVIGWDVYNPR